MSTKRQVQKRQYARDHPDRMAKANKKYRQSIKGQIYKVKTRARQRAKRCISGQLRFKPKFKTKAEYYVFRRRNHLQYAIAHRLRSRLLRSLDRYRTHPRYRFIPWLGCSMLEFIVHLESQFLPGMTWCNRNLWHIDHITPLCDFDLTDPKQSLEATHYSNLRPLWSKDNQRHIR